MLYSVKSYSCFEEALANYDPKSFQSCGTGSYADVFRHPQRRLIFKLIRLLPEYLLERHFKGRASKYADALSEYQISAALSKLNNNNHINYCQMFPVIQRAFLVSHGTQLPDYLKFSGEEEEGEEEKGEDANAYMLSIPHETMVLVMEDCGQPMRQLIDDLHPLALLSILKQIITGFAVAESALEFEHRDLHSGNILLQPSSQKYICYTLRRTSVRIPSHGYRVKIIDTTFSRIRTGNRYGKDTLHFFSTRRILTNIFYRSASALHRFDASL